ncbi:DUF3545 domain-containing protein [Aliidiomarina shirensis]|uniref:DUF3545 domain-containing protein n=1 Tax=Aliidiomarina shirensis TaxID=1048642 RepID=A0A432WUK1_9GAMM|nr:MULTISPECIES: DUF3545 family protein [Idiomarinaceae]EGN74739.1 Protein of unknown function (DUF3545) [Idiomarina sp. A28L]RUO37446.1 DUF3545 domain-containing protein [Aliidiomarina shirensis]
MNDELNNTEKSSKGRAAKRKWREIEAIQERQRLEKELTDIDYCYDLETDDLEF